MGHWERGRIQPRSDQSVTQPVVNVAVGNQIDDLVFRRHLPGQLVEIHRRDDDGENTFAEVFCGPELRNADRRRKPVFGDKAQDCLATVRRLTQRFLPPLASGDPAFRVEIQEDVVPTVLHQPGVERRRLFVVLAGVTDEKPRHRRLPAVVDVEEV